MLAIHGVILDRIALIFIDGNTTWVVVVIAVRSGTCYVLFQLRNRDERRYFEKIFAPPGGGGNPNPKEVKSTSTFITPKKSTYMDGQQPAVVGSPGNIPVI